MPRLVVIEVAWPCPAVMAPHVADPAFLSTSSGDDDMKLVMPVKLHWREVGDVVLSAEAPG